jgi:hypothetical protein
MGRPDSVLTLLTGTACLAWGSAGAVLALVRSGLTRAGRAYQGLPVQAGARWVVERIHASMNGYGKLRRCTERDAAIVDFYLYLAPEQRKRT